MIVVTPSQMFCGLSVVRYDLGSEVAYATQTSWIVLLHTTMSDRWSVVSMWGERHRTGIMWEGSARIWYSSGKLLAMDLEMTSKTALCCSLYRCMLSALGQLLRT